MTDDPIQKQLRELSWRRKLTVTEETRLRAWLAAHPQAQEDWDLETALTEALGLLPNVPVASNFTARVLETVELEARGQERHQWWTWGHWKGWKQWLPRMAFAAVLLGAGLFSYREYHTLTERTQIALSLKAVSDVAVLSSPSVLEDFDVIRAMSPTPVADEDLLSALQ